MVRSGRAIQSFTQQEMDIKHSGEKAFGKWSKLLNAADPCSVLATSLGGISDVRVSPLLQSEWSQSTECGNLPATITTRRNMMAVPLSLRLRCHSDGPVYAVLAIPDGGCRDGMFYGIC